MAAAGAEIGAPAGQVAPSGEIVLRGQPPVGASLDETEDQRAQADRAEQEAVDVKAAREAVSARLRHVQDDARQDEHADRQVDEEDPPPDRRWLTLVVLSLGVALMVIDGTIVNAALPVIIRDMHLDFTEAQWVSTLYALVFAGLLITTGRLGDRLGRRRLFAAGADRSGSSRPPGRWAAQRPRTGWFLRAISIASSDAEHGPLLGGWLTTDVSWQAVAVHKSGRSAVGHVVRRSMREPRSSDRGFADDASVDELDDLVGAVQVGVVVGDEDGGGGQ